MSLLQVNYYSYLNYGIHSCNRALWLIFIIAKVGKKWWLEINNILLMLSNYYLLYCYMKFTLVITFSDEVWQWSLLESSVCQFWTSWEQEELHMIYSMSFLGTSHFVIHCCSLVLISFIPTLQVALLAVIWLKIKNNNGVCYIVFNALLEIYSIFNIQGFLTSKE